VSADDPLDPLFAAVRAEVHARADAGGRVRDFAGMIARAHALDPAAVPEEVVAEAAQFAPVVALRGAPAVREDRCEAPRRRGTGWLAGAAAALLLAAGLAGAVRLARHEAEPSTAHAVPLVGPSAAASEAASERSERRPSGGGARPGRAPAGEGALNDVKDMSEETGEPTGLAEPVSEGPAELAEPASEGPPEGAPAGADDRAGGQRSGSGAQGGSEVRIDRPARAAGSGSLGHDRSGRAADRRADGVAPESAPVQAPATGESAWDTLDRAAREAWRRGDIAEARALLTALVRSDAEAARIELAYGDLFVLARRTDDADELARLWREYLVRFPRGLYSEDARAGLCRRASGEARRACWQLYLETWPEGAHAGAAREAM
jgi:hypothetical protein